MPPEACQSICGWRRAASWYNATLGPAERAVAGDVGTQHMPQVRRGVIVHGAPQGRRRLLLPSVGRDPRYACRIDAHIEGQRDSLRAEMLQPALHLLHLGESSAADHHARCACIQHQLERRSIAQTASDLQLDGPLRSQPHDDCLIVELSVAGAVEIDDVQPVGAQVFILRKQILRIRRVARFAGEIALPQTHAAAGFQIDGGNQTHRCGAMLEGRRVTQSPRKFSSRRAPTLAERSG